MRGLLIRVGIIGIIVVGAFVLRPFVSGSAGDLKVGDCFDLPSATATTVKEVQHHPCDQSHGGEVIYVGNYAGSKSDPFPGDDQILAFVTQKCVPAYQTYTGTGVDSQGEFDIGWFQPTSEGWKGGDQGITCYLYRVDSAAFKGSQKKS